ncbi:MAG: tRNA (N(6)-L-threonylcarbamoyladenosine(37)-C(2))-methylthiotransferase MtaB, partial [Bacteroidota bacterium]
DAHFENTLALVEETSLAFLHAFPYSPRPGTPAARMPQVDRLVVKERAARLRAAGAKALNRHLVGQDIYASHLLLVKKTLEQQFLEILNQNDA